MTLEEDRVGERLVVTSEWYQSKLRTWEGSATTRELVGKSNMVTNLELDKEFDE